MVRRLRGRFWVAITIAIPTAGLAFLTFLSPTWIEELFGIDPDQGSGALEWALLGGVVVALIAVVVAGFEWRRAWAIERRTTAVDPSR